MSKEWVNEVRKRMAANLSGVPKLNSGVVSKRMQVTTAPNKQTALLLLVAVVIGLALLLSMTRGTQSVPATEVSPSLNSTPVSPNSAPVTLESVKRSLDGLNTRVSILGAMHNNNWRALAEGSDKENLVFIERDWKMSKMVPMLQIPPNDQAFFQQWTVK